ncbi:MAG TPA: LysR family transcriptional regulator [Acetobacteraceae bacterium]|jgi:DNA-binding transcriptional LysR family regulator|nr:LysR family transcriptional regulator [Acetobacteraceae bacterium]
MDIDGVETFRAIAELGSFTSAARHLHRSQPAISRRLDIVEHDLGAPLFERLRGRARPDPGQSGEASKIRTPP